MIERYGSKRTTQTRAVLPVINVACDDTRTAVEYFKLLKQEVQGEKVVNVMPASRCGADANSVIQSLRTPSPEDARDASFALIDTDTNPDVGRIRLKARENRITALFSNPCFEVWTLAHLQDTGEAFLNCTAVLARLKQKWKEEFGTDLGPKAQARFEKLTPKRASAIGNCKRRSPERDQSWSEVWQAVETILSR